MRCSSFPRGPASRNSRRARDGKANENRRARTRAIEPARVLSFFFLCFPFFLSRPHHRAGLCVNCVTVIAVVSILFRFFFLSFFSANFQLELVSSFCVVYMRRYRGYSRSQKFTFFDSINTLSVILVALAELVANF